MGVGSNIGWTLFHTYLVQKLQCLFEKIKNEKGRGWPILKTRPKKRCFVKLKNGRSLSYLNLLLN